MATGKKQLGKAGGRKSPAKTTTTKAERQAVAKEVDETPDAYRRYKPVTFRYVVSTGCTLLDLAISGGRVHGGGLPGGIMVEFYGPPGGGKSALLTEVCAETQHADKPGDVQYFDPEGRLDRPYATQVSGLVIPDDNYKRPDTVTEMFDLMFNYQPKLPGITVTAVDSIAALSTDQEIGVTDAGTKTFKGEDKYGGRRGKEFSTGLRKFGRFIAQEDHLLVVSNQIRDDFKTGGTTTPGGHGVRFYASLRVEIKRAYGGAGWRIERSRKLASGKQVTKQVGVVSECYVAKSSIDDPFRSALLYYLFDYGIDDVRGNLQYLKDMLKLGKYEFRNLSAQSMDLMIQKIEDADLEDALREEVIALWGEIEEKFEVERKPKSKGR